MNPKNCQLGICINYPGTKPRSIPIKYADNIKLESMENKKDFKKSHRKNLDDLQDWLLETGSNSIVQTANLCT